MKIGTKSPAWLEAKWDQGDDPRCLVGHHSRQLEDGRRLSYLGIRV